MNKKSSLKINFIYNTISQLLTLIIPLITTPYVSRILHEEGNGQYSYAYSIITYFVLFAGLGFNVYGQREIAKCKDDINKCSKTFYEILIIRSIFTIISFALLLTLTLSIGFGKYTYLIIILSSLVIGAALDVNFFFQGIENFRLIALRNIVLRVITLIGIFLFVKEEDHVWVYALCISLSTIISYLMMWPSIFKNIVKMPIKSLEIKKHFKPSILIFLPTLSATVYTVFDKTMIGLLAPNPDYANGCYEQAFKINNVGLTVICLISPILIPRNANDYSNKRFDELKRHLKLGINYVFIISLAFMAGFLTLSDNVSSWFLGDGYKEVPTLLRIMSIRLVAGGLVVVIGEQLFIAIGKEKYHSIATLSAAIGNVIINLLLIPVYGAIGAAIATAISELLVLGVLLLFVRKSEFISVRSIIKYSLKYLLSAILMFEVMYLINNGINIDGFVAFLVVGFSGVITYFISLLILQDELVMDVIRFGISFLKKKEAKI